MNVSCPRCETTYRVDPRKVPVGGVRARCARCPEIFRVEPEAADAAGAPGAPPPIAPASHAPAAEPETAVEASSETVPAPAPAPVERETESARTEPAAAPVFGVSDPHARARRLARALVSDIVVYHPERRERSRAAGTLRQEFREEIRKSWEEYTVQIGEDLARDTSYFRDALNEILAGGQRVF